MISRRLSSSWLRAALVASIALGVAVGCGSSASTGSSSAPTPSASSSFACGSLVTDVKDLASTVSSSSKTNQEKADAAKALASQISDDAKAASGAVKDKLNALSSAVSALASSLTSGAGTDQIKKDVSAVVSAATSTAKVCITN